MKSPQDYAKLIFARKTTDRFGEVSAIHFGPGVKVEFDGYDRAGVSVSAHPGPMCLKEGREFVRSVQTAQDYAEDVDTELKRLWEQKND
jgi:hypothetical protein